MLPAMTPAGAEPPAQTEAVPEPFEEFYRREYRRLVALGIALTGDRGRAEELAQDACFAAHRNWGRISRYDAPGAWVRRAVVNRSRSSWRRRSAETRALERLVRAQAPVADGVGVDPDRFWALVRTLPTRQAQCVALRYLDDLTTLEIARVLGCSEATVRVHLHRGRAALAQILSLDLDREQES
jgi:RNA polymerase sigma-70 factor (sigma-E family)